MPKITVAKLKECQRLLEYAFHNPGWLEKALTHPSDRFDDGCSNERLEFLGDSILGMVISEHLFETFDDRAEGRLTYIKSVVVSGQTLARSCHARRIEQFISVGKGMPGNGDLPDSVLANVFEAVVAAIYIDGGLPEARRFVLESLRGEIDRVVEDRHELNYKSILQQFSQRELGCTPCYRVVGHSGPDHERSFQVITVINEAEYESAWGRSKKEAEQRSAQLSYDRLLLEYGRDDIQDSDDE